MMKLIHRVFFALKGRPVLVKKALHILSILCKPSKLGDKTFRSSANSTIPKYFMPILQPSLLSSSSAIKSSRQSVNKIGDKTEPCLTPVVAPKGSDKAFFHLTHI